MTSRKSYAVSIHKQLEQVFIHLFRRTKFKSAKYRIAGSLLGLSHCDPLTSWTTGQWCKKRIDIILLPYRNVLILLQFHIKVAPKAWLSHNKCLILLFLIKGPYNRKQELSNLNKVHTAYQKILWQLTSRYNLPITDITLCLHVEFWDYCVYNPLFHSDVISPNSSGSTTTQAMVCGLTATHHNLTQF